MAIPSQGWKRAETIPTRRIHSSMAKHGSRATSTSPTNAPRPGLSLQSKTNEHRATVAALYECRSFLESTTSDGKRGRHWRASCWNFRGLSSGHVAVGFMPAFKYRQKNFLIVLERGHKAQGYVSAGEASKIPTGGPPMMTRLSATADLLIWTSQVATVGFKRYSRVFQHPISLGDLYVCPRITHYRIICGMEVTYAGIEQDRWFRSDERLRQSAHVLRKGPRPRIREPGSVRDRIQSGRQHDSNCKGGFHARAVYDSGLGGSDHRQSREGTDRPGSHFRKIFVPETE